jgi:hypothetical protein
MKKSLYSFLWLLVALPLPAQQVLKERSNPVQISVGTPVQSTPPALVWITPSEKQITVTAAELVLKVGVNSVLTLKNVKIYINGIEQAEARSTSSVSPDAYKYARYVERTLVLAPGNNEVKIAAENDKGEMVTETRMVTYTLPVAVTAELGEEYKYKGPAYHALVIGVSDYKFSGPGLPDLENPVKDAQRFMDLLTNRYTFEKENVTMLQNPTRQEVIDAFEHLSSTLTDKDNLLIFYAGHGYFDKQKELGFWMPSDATRTSRANWVANSTIKDYIRSTPAKHTLLITDACFGGSIFKTRAVEAEMAMKIYQMYKDPSRKALTSGNLSEVPDKSVFLDQLIKKLGENEDDFLPVTNLYTRIYEPVANNTSTIPQFGVIQESGDEGGYFIFVRRK